MPKVVNLNKLASNSERTRVLFHNNIKLAFDTDLILKTLMDRIKRPDTKYIMGCAAWFTNTKLIECMSKHLRGVSMICTRDKVARTKHSKAKYKTLPKADGVPRVRLLGSGRGRSASLMHHKFLVGLDKDQMPIWVSTGSFNLTESANTNIENLMIIEDKEVAMSFLKEFQRLYPLSKTLGLR